MWKFFVAGALAAAAVAPVDAFGPAVANASSFFNVTPPPPLILVFLEETFSSIG
jgi:hypothetical protein